MTRVASLCLAHLPIERLLQAERSAKPRDAGPVNLDPRVPAAIDDNPGACSVPRGGGWRPGARWARDEQLSVRPISEQIDALPAHQRPTIRTLGRRSEPAGHPFRAMPSDEGAPPSITLRASKRPGHQRRPLILIMRTGQRDVVTSVCPLAATLGLRPGMPAAQARALVTDLDVRDAEPDADRAWLDRLALHAITHWTPTASVSGSDGLWLDITGASHLFGGEERFCQRLLRFLDRIGFTATIAIAGTPGAAHALARFVDTPIVILPPARETEAIADLPLMALRLPPEALDAAARFGLERVADLYPMARAPLARRLGMVVVERLDQARGAVGEPITPIVPFEAPRVERRLLEPIGTTETINQVIGDLVDDLVGVLQARGLGLRTAILSCRIVDSSDQRVAIGTARATRDPKHLKRMFAMRVERIDPGLGIEAMGLTVPRVEDLQAEGMAASFMGQDRSRDVAQLVDQLGCRVGSDALFRIGAVESDVPERACRKVGPLVEPLGWPRWLRPARLLARPEALSGVVALLPDHPPRRFIWRGRAYRVVADDGPERIHGEWWRRRGELWAVRDYFRVEAEGGARFWIFRRGDGVDPLTGDLTWYMHGLFG